MHCAVVPVTCPAKANRCESIPLRSVPVRVMPVLSSYFMPLMMKYLLSYLIMSLRRKTFSISVSKCRSIVNSPEPANFNLQLKLLILLVTNFTLSEKTCSPSGGEKNCANISYHPRCKFPETDDRNRVLKVIQKSCHSYGIASRQKHDIAYVSFCAENAV